jgi:hypothetical protein
VAAAELPTFEAPPREPPPLAPQGDEAVKYAEPKVTRKLVSER